MGKAGIKKETVKQQRTKNQPTAVDRMKKMPKKKAGAKGKRKRMNDTEDESATKKKRTGSYRAPTKEERCHMKVTVFLNKQDDHYYLSSNSCLDHTNHNYIPGEAVLKGSKEVDEDKQNFIQLLFDSGITNSAISNVLNKMDGDGEFLPKTISNLTTKMSRARKIAQGISDDATSAEKAMKALEV